MNIFDELGAIYFEIDTQYARIELEARSRSHNRKEAKFQEKRKINDQAYFLFMFTRLEDRIKTIATSVIDSKYSSITKYQNKRAWEIIKSKNDKDTLNLMERVSFCTAFNGADYHLILNYKKLRDTIAHGGTATVINMTAVLTDMNRLYDDLKS